MKYFFLLLVLVSCTQFIEKLDDGTHYVKNLDKENLSLVFSHNINGETHPCGCRHLPLGGLPQVAGLFHNLKEKNAFIYVDTGDAFFPSTTIPQSIDQSIRFTANSIVKSFNDMGLSYFVPGDQDFAGGIDFLAEVAKNAKFKFLVANFAENSPIIHQKWTIIKKGPHKIFMAGIVDPEIVPIGYRYLFTPKYQAIENVIKEMKDKDGYSETDPFHRLIILSHAGLKPDEELAKKYQNIDWIIGSHSQSFLRAPYPEGKTKIVQVLSRNHYIGEIIISFANDKTKDSYKIHEIRDELKDNLKQNPWLAFIDKHKEDLSRVQVEEQKLQFKSHNHENLKFETAKSCLDCHQDQADKWQKTPHAIAYHTLVKAGEANNLQCINCHALGTNDPRGFSTAKDMVVFAEAGENKHEQYWKDVAEAFKDIETVRGTSEVRILKASNDWLKIDEKHGVTHNFANVQCLNCHDQHPDHPFTISEKIPKEVRLANMKNKCLNCHNPDQSPEWYNEDSRGLRSALNEELLNKHIEKIACPKQKEESN